jgi:hypothetical protein
MGKRLSGQSSSLLSDLFCAVPLNSSLSEPATPENISRLE